MLFTLPLCSLLLRTLHFRHYPLLLLGSYGMMGVNFNLRLTLATSSLSGSGLAWPLSLGSMSPSAGRAVIFPGPSPSLMKGTLCCAYSLSRVRLCDRGDCSPPGSSVRGDSPGKNTGVGCYALLQEIFPTQGSNPGLLHRRRFLYLLGYQGTLIA